MAEESKSLILIDGDNPEPSYAELRSEVGDLREKLDLVLQMVGGQKPQAEPAERTIDKLLREMEEGYSEEQLAKAEAWVKKQIGGRLIMQAGPAGGGAQGAEVIFERYEVTPADRESGRTTLPDGFRITRSIPVRVLARFYIKVILDESYESEAERLMAVILDARKRGKGKVSLQPELENLLDENGKLKRMRIRGRKHLKKERSH